MLMNINPNASALSAKILQKATANVDFLSKTVP
jgi:hypothetical protein